MTGTKSKNSSLDHRNSGQYLAAPSQTADGVEDPLIHSPLPTQHVNKKTDRLIGKLRSMELVMPGAVGHFYQLQMVLEAAKHASQATSYIYKGFHRVMQCWKYLCLDMGSRPTFFVEIVQCLATDVGYTNALGLEFGGVWINPNDDGVHYVCCLPWPEDILADLVSNDNP